jgi:aryl-alcohol dehydrogenase-like predicted oxidoreductase
MKYRRLGKTNFEVSEVSLGTWQIGGSWGSVSEEDAKRLLHAAIDQGINFFDTADVYGDGRSERLIAQVLTERSEKIYVATKAGRRLQPHTAAGYNKENLTAFVERSLANLKRDALDLAQLHCPPWETYYQPETFSALDELKRAGKILHYGVSVEKVEEAIKATEYPGVATVQIIFNWILKHEAVSCVIPGARKERQVVENAQAAELPPLSPEHMETLTRIYQDQILPLVHHRW